MRRRNFWNNLNPSEADMLSVGKYAQMNLGESLLDLFGGSTTPIYVGLTVTAGAGLSINISTGRVYAGMAMDGTIVGDQAGLAADSVTVLKFGSQNSGVNGYTTDGTLTFTAPGSGSNYYLLEATLTEGDINALLDFYVDSSGNQSNQYQFADRQVSIVYKLKVSTSSTPSADGGYVGIAAITIPSGTVSMSGATISQAAYVPFLGFAQTLGGGSGFVHLSPGSADSGYISITGNIITSGGNMQFGATSGAYISSNASGTNAAFAMDAVNGAFTTGNLLELRVGGTAKFVVGNSGVLSVASGGTGTATPSALAGTGLTVTGTWPAQTIAIDPTYILPVAQGGTGSSSPTLSAGVGISVSGVWPNQTIALSTGLPLPIAFGGTGTPTPALVAGTGIAITGSWPNQTVAWAPSPIGTIVTSHGSIPSGGAGTVNKSLAIPVAGSTWFVEVIWFANGNNAGTGITLAAGSMSGASTSAGGGSGTNSFLGGSLVGNAAGNQTLTFSFTTTNQGGTATLNPGTYSIKAVRTA